MDTVNLTATAILRFAPNARDNIVAALVGGNSALQAAAIVPPLRLAHFLAQIATETGGFTIYEEDLNYSAARLTQVWPSHFPDTAAAAPYAHNPQELANYIYADANRSAGYRLGNTEPGDGWRYRGRGLIQTTGREGYRAAGYEDNPDALEDPAVGLDAAIGEFVRSGCLALADADDVAGVRRRINGGTIGLDQCRAWLAKAKAIFAAPAAARPSGPWEAPGWEEACAPGGTPLIAWTQESLNLADPSLAPLRLDGINGSKTSARLAYFRVARGMRTFAGLDQVLIDALAAFNARPPAIAA